ncbi:MAG: LamG-like jellyroll fold domain-containing protein [Promethearchaeota archaeon]
MKIKKRILVFLVLLYVTMILVVNVPVNSLSITPLDSVIPLKTLKDSQRLTNVEEGLVGYWNFNERIGNIVHDQSDNSNDGTIYGANWTTGISGSALEFDGVKDFVEIPHHDSLNLGTEDFTVSLWINYYSLTSEETLVEKYYDYPTQLGWTITSYPQSSIIRIHAGNEDGSYNEPLDVNVGVINIETWYMLTVTRTSGNISIYWNYDFIGSYMFGDSLNTGEPVIIGKRYYDAFHFNGIIDEVRIYKRALSVGEIQAHYNPASDYDADGIPDYYEIQVGTDPNVDDSDHDSDGDGLSNLEEYVYNTDPNHADTDRDGLSDYNEVKKFHTDPNDADSDNDFFPDGLDSGWCGNPHTNWDNLLTRTMFLILIFGFLGLGIWGGYVAIQLPKLQQDLKLLYQHFQQYTQQFQESIAVIKNQESLEELETVAEHIYVTFQSYEDFFLFAQELVNRKWLPTFLRPDLIAWETVFINMKHTFEDFQQTRLKRLEAKY